MNEDPWKEKEKVKVSTIISCATKDFIKSSKNKIFTEVQCDDEDFRPRYNEKAQADVFANLSEDWQLIKPNGMTSVDCGCSLKILDGYKISVASAVSGLILVNNTVENRIKLTMINVSGKNINIRHKSKIGKIWIEPIYLFDWKEENYE